MACDTSISIENKVFAVPDRESGVTRGDTVDDAVVTGFGKEWSRFPQERLSSAERRALFAQYFAVFPWSAVDPETSIGADLGCGTGRWAIEAAPRAGRLHLDDASAEALAVARGNLAREGIPNVEFHHAEIGRLPFPDASLDFAYSLGVLHHVPDCDRALAATVSKLKPGAPLLLYLYYNFENRPYWFRTLWMVSDLLRRLVSRCPFWLRAFVADIVAALVYWPLARSAALLERLGRLPPAWPLAAYRHASFYTMRTDALDKLGTRIERRFSRAEISAMLDRAGMECVMFSDQVPYWCVSARKHAG